MVVFSPEQSVKMYRSYCDIGHHDYGILWMFHEGRLYTHECQGEQATHGIFHEVYQLNFKGFQYCGRYCLKTKVLSVIGNPPKTLLKRLLKKFPYTEYMAYFA